MQLNIRHELPSELLKLGANQLHRELRGPTLFHLQGRLERPLFLSVLQHGNETTGWEALRSWLDERNGAELPRSLLMFVANPLAARDHQRMVAGQPDFNRCWPGTDSESGDVVAMLAQVTDIARRAGLFASVDIHNNSGRNPHYGATTRLQAQWLGLARMFDHRAVYFQQPLGVQCEAFSRLCPSITVECGLAGLKEGVPHCHDYIDRLMKAQSLPSSFQDDLNLYHTVARVKVRPDLDFVFGKKVDGAVHFRIDLDALNFLPLPANTPLAQGHLGELGSMLDARDDQGRDVTGQYFEVSNGALRTRRQLTLSMLSRRPEIVRKDCLCYVMEKLPTPRLSPSAGLSEQRQTVTSP